MTDTSTPRPASGRRRSAKRVTGAASGPTAAATPSSPLPVAVALQGGGSHGAFAWGALDALLDRDALEVEGISGTSAGAMNAAVYAHGIAAGGRVGARAALRAFWHAVSEAARFSPFQRSPLDVAQGKWTLDTSPAFMAMDLLARIVSPYTLGGFGGNPLRDILEDIIDFRALADGPVKLFITATNVRTGRGRVFRKHEITADVLLASACLPSMFQAIEIDGDPYWDGGYSGNPTLTPLVNECDSHDIFLVQINPVERPGTPRTAREIASRLNEVSFNAVLLKELRMMAVLRRVLDAGTGEGQHWAGMRIHRIASDFMVELGHSSKLNAEWAFLELLHGKGREAAAAFAAEHAGDVGVRSTLDIDALLDGI